MFKSKKAIFSFFALTLGFLQFTYANNNIEMLVKFDVTYPQLLTNASLEDGKEKYEVTCSGLKTTTYPNGYQITSTKYDSKGLEFGVTGPFPEDKREICKLKDQHTGNENQMYFTVKNLPIKFTYDGVEHTCLIDQQVGTSWNNADRKNNKLQGENSKEEISCGGIPGDTYTVHHGAGDDKGNITIKVPRSPSGDIMFRLEFQPNEKITNVKLGTSYNLKCAGWNNYYTVTAESKVRTYKMIDTDVNLIIEHYNTSYKAQGPYDADNLQTCKINEDGEEKPVYFTVYGMSLSYEHNGVVHTCYIDQDVGFTKHSVLVANTIKKSLPCNGSVDGDTYKINKTASIDITEKYDGKKLKQAIKLYTGK